MESLMSSTMFLGRPACHAGSSRTSGLSQVVIKKQTFDSGGPVKRPEAHPGCAFADGGDDIGRIFGRGGESGMLEAVYASDQAAADFLWTVCVCDHSEFVLVRLVHYGHDL